MKTDALLLWLILFLLPVAGMATLALLNRGTATRSTRQWRITASLIVGIPTALAAFGVVSTLANGWIYALIPLGIVVVNLGALSNLLSPLRWLQFLPLPVAALLPIAVYLLGPVISWDVHEVPPGANPQSVFFGGVMVVLLHTAPVLAAVLVSGQFPATDAATQRPSMRSGSPR